MEIIKTFEQFFEHMEKVELVTIESEQIKEGNRNTNDIMVFGEFTLANEIRGFFEQDERSAHKAFRNRAYFIVKIELRKVKDGNEKSEYRALRNAMEENGFIDAIPINDTKSLKLPNGVYASVNIKGAEINSVSELVKNAIKTALHPFYGGNWEKKYTFMLLETSSIVTANLKYKKA